MKLIKPSFEIIEPTSYDLDGMYKHIELCGRTCYKSTDKITPESAMPFVDRMYRSQHYAMLEHGTVYLHITEEQGKAYWYILDKYSDNKYSVVVENPKHIEGTNPMDSYITTNFRVIIENHWIDDLKYMCKPTEYHAKRHTVKFICNRQVSHEFVRHRGSLGFGFAQESTRYCNYTKGKFGGELTFIEPCWYMDMEDKRILNTELSSIEATYFRLINKGWKPQQAATILPNALKTELIMTGFEKDWSHFFDLRALGTTGAPHPQAMELAKPLLKEFINRGYLKSTNEEGQCYIYNSSC